MITANNIETVFDLISEKELNEVMQSKSDYIALSIGGYGNVFLESVEYNEETEAEVQSCG